MDIAPSPTLRLPPAFFPNLPTPPTQVSAQRIGDFNNNDKIFTPRKVGTTRFRTLEKGPTSICFSTSDINSTSPDSTYGFGDKPLLGNHRANRRAFFDEEDKDSGIYDFDEYLRSPIIKDSVINGNNHREKTLNDALRCPVNKDARQNGGQEFWSVFEYDRSPKSRPRHSADIGTGVDRSESRGNADFKAITSDGLRSELKVKPINDSENDECRKIELAALPGGFACNHKICHKCIRKHCGVGVKSPDAIVCPICGEPLKKDAQNDDGRDKNDGDSSLVSRKRNQGGVDTFIGMVKRFEDVDLNIRRLKHEAVDSAKVEMQYTGVRCDLCWENHGILKVVQESDRLAVEHKRPENAGMYYRLRSGEVVTSYTSKVTSSSVCVSCTYKNLHERDDLTVANKGSAGDERLKEVSRVVMRKAASVIGLEGECQTDMEHQISMHTRADNFNFRRASQYLADAISQQEKELVAGIESFVSSRPGVTSQIEDDGKMYSVRHRDHVDFKEMRLNKVRAVNRNSMQTEIW